MAVIGAELAKTEAPDIPRDRALSDMVIAHYEAMLSFYGAELGMRVARKHLGWYMDHANTAAKPRRNLLTERDPREVIRLLPSALEMELEHAV